MDALGLIETRGFTGAIIAADTALKAANVRLIKAEVIKGGLVTVQFTGDVGAMKAAVEAGSDAVKPRGVFIASHVIPRMHPETYQLVEEIPDTKAGKEQEKELQALNIAADVKEKDTAENQEEQEKTKKQKAVAKQEEKLLIPENLTKLTVNELRKLVRQRKAMQDDVKAIKFARKDELIKRLLEIDREGESDGDGQGPTVHS